jgi:OmpA-OmpF porin, OOP family
MTRSEVRTQDAWGSFDRFAMWIIPIILLLLLIFVLPAIGYGPSNSGCCGAGTDSKAAAVSTPAPATPAPPAPAAPAAPPVAAAPPQPAPAIAPAPAAPVATAPPVAAAPVAAEPKIDCGSIMQGVAVNFTKGSAVLSDDGKRALDQVAKCLSADKYEVAGHTDSDGSDAMNQKLSEARAKSVVTYLLTKGVAQARMMAAGYGESKPVADNNSTEGKAKNRRITFTPK